MAVAEAAESVTVLSALLVAMDPLWGKASKARLPSEPFANIPPTRTCSGPMPSPMKRMTLLGPPSGASGDTPPARELPEPHPRKRRMMRKMAQRSLSLRGTCAMFGLPVISPARRRQFSSLLRLSAVDSSRPDAYNFKLSTKNPVSGR
jgi:hypothetical protein